MNFIEKLNEVPGKECVYIGTKKGTAWIWIGHAKECRESVDQINEYILNRRKNSISLCEARISASKTRYKEAEENISALTKEKPETTGGMSDLIKNINISLVKMKTAVSDIESDDRKKAVLEKKLAEMKKVQDREVVNTFTHEVDIPGLSIILEGDDDGEFWDLKEFRNGGRERN